MKRTSCVRRNSPSLRKMLLLCTLTVDVATPIKCAISLSESPHVISCAIIYCTDVYANEPAINPEIIQYANICTPHIAGHSIDAKYKTMLHLRDCIHHQYGVSLPENTEHTTTMLKIDYTKNWEDQILQIYNPYIETKRLQQATNLQETFLRLRQEHKFRCEFSNIPNCSAP